MASNVKEFPQSTSTPNLLSGVLSRMVRLHRVYTFDGQPREKCLSFRFYSRVGILDSGWCLSCPLSDLDSNSRHCTRRWISDPTEQPRILPVTEWVIIWYIGNTDVNNNSSKFLLHPEVHVTKLDDSGLYEVILFHLLNLFSKDFWHGNLVVLLTLNLWSYK